MHNKRIIQRGVAALALAAVALLNVQAGRAQGPVVRAVLFFSPTCGHCQKVIQEDLPPLLEKYGDQLSILGINIANEAGVELYRAAIERYQIPQERRGVPCLIVGDTIMVGSAEIPQKFPGIIEDGLASGGIPWPDIPDLDKVLTEEGLDAPSEETPVEGRVAGDTEGVSFSLAALKARFNQDLVGNSLAVIVLLALIASVILTSYQIVRMKNFTNEDWPAWTFLALILVGLVAAIYLSYVEVTQSEAVCGPVGDCNTVQQSPYARLFGVLPIGILGVVGYALIAGAWMVERYGRSYWQQRGALAVWGLALMGALFSIYLTFLEPFVIGATCAWCLTSAVVMALLLWAATKPAIDAWKAVSPA